MQELGADGIDDALDLLPEAGMEDDSDPASGTAVPDISFGYFHTEHFLKAHRLGTKLEIRCLPMRHARLVFDWTDILALDFNRICTT